MDLPAGYGADLSGILSRIEMISRKDAKTAKIKQRSEKDGAAKD
jgi:hypothetical protein